MKLVYSKPFDQTEKILIQNIADECGITFDTARLLFYRNIDSVSKAKRFLNPSKRNFYSPFLLKGVKDAKERINLASNLSQSVLVFGDYDADGICATTVLYNVLKLMNIDVRVAIPERDDGYGLNLDIISRLHNEKPIDLIITVDCGISDNDVVLAIKKLGIEVIVTDHHEPPEILPDCICINPKITGQEYPFNGLCGAGVAYKLGVALIGDDADQFLDLVALATISDSMELIDENRDIVKEGLKLFNTTKLRPCFQYLLGDVNKQITAQSLAFTIAPRINAGGRMGDANSSLKLFITHDQTEIFNLSSKLCAYNIERQAECDKIYRQAKEMIISSKIYKDQVIVIFDKEWKTGFVGIVAARLVEEFCRPVIVFAGHDDFLKGSARSIDGINIHDAVGFASDLLITYGGHSQAAGVSVSFENFTAFREKINRYVLDNYGILDTTKKAYLEWDVTEPISSRFAREIEELEPFGMGNRRPVFSVTEKYSVTATPLKEGSTHCSFRSFGMDMLYFNGVEDIDKLYMPVTKKIIFEPNVSVYKSKSYFKGYVKGVNFEREGLDLADLDAFSLSLKSVLSKENCAKNNPVEIVEDLPKFFPYGTIYAVYTGGIATAIADRLGVQIDMLAPQNKSLASSVVYCPKNIPDGYDRVVYVDKPICYLNTQCKCYQLKDATDLSADLKTDRETFKQVFNSIKGLVGKEFLGVSWLPKLINSEYSAKQLTFCFEVFLELEFFYVERGKLYQNLFAKSSLDNSKIYNKICSLRDL